MYESPVFFSDLTFPKGMEEIGRCGCGFWPRRDEMKGLRDMGKLNEVTRHLAPFRVTDFDRREYTTFDKALREAIRHFDGSSPEIFGNDGKLVCVVDLT